MATAPYRCRDCGKTFDLPAAVKAKYPTWTPAKCMECRNGKKAAPASPTPGSLTLAEVRKRYRDGPQDGVFTDGSCSGNPGPGGWGAVRVVSGEPVEQRYGQEAQTTNNRMELTAMIEGLSMLAPGDEGIVYSDSSLVVNTLTKWAAGWEKRGWKRKEGPVKNLDLVQRAYALAQERPDVRIEWIRAHDGSLWNEYADGLATAYLREEL